MITDSFKSNTELATRIPTCLVSCLRVCAVWAFSAFIWTAKQKAYTPPHTHQKEYIYKISVVYRTFYKTKFRFRTNLVWITRFYTLHFQTVLVSRLLRYKWLLGQAHENSIEFSLLYRQKCAVWVWHLRVLRSHSKVRTVMEFPWRSLQIGLLGLQDPLFNCQLHIHADLRLWRELNQAWPSSDNSSLCYCAAPTRRCWPCALQSCINPKLATHCLRDALCRGPSTGLAAPW